MESRISGMIEYSWYEVQRSEDEVNKGAAA